MRVWPWRRQEPQPSDEATTSQHQAGRALLDARNLASRVDKVAGDLAATDRRNHFGASVARSMRRH